MNTKDQPPVLSFEGVTTEPEAIYDVPLWGFNFTLGPGELFLVRLERGHYQIPLADVAIGLVEPVEGTVRFGGEDWRRMSPDRAAARRGRCGRVFSGQNWCSEMTVGDNITLARRHHSDRPEREIESEAANLARYFGLPGLPMRPPGRSLRGDLGRAALVRSFIGRPELIVLEQPTRHLFPEIMPPLINAVGAARSRGAAVIWLTAEPQVWDDDGLRAELRGTMFGSRMQEE